MEASFYCFLYCGELLRRDAFILILLNILKTGKRVTDSNLPE